MFFPSDPLVLHQFARYYAPLHSQAFINGTQCAHLLPDYLLAMLAPRCYVAWGKLGALCSPFQLLLIVTVMKCTKMVYRITVNLFSKSETKH